ncbi:hypothetical protein PAXRUDRAFT_22601 [Paxillus rubicundulus Ve08.2h10]|uniref:Uncharacterized protein n=1 Tax=Paxillus rubicundulus Ve08.2h10 TaxID=930991 RepID=A0A0D0BJX9_9AGAM|nr:hypothetical protein PAXRUDRAFT_22601 [Paxillus rubicundulus Ve08.2h10]
MSPSTTNDLSKWSDEQLRENEDDDDELFEKKSAERRRWTKVRKEVERRMAEEAARRKVEEEAKRKAEVEAQRRAEAEVKAGAEFDLGPIEGETAEGDGKWDRGGRGVGRGLTPVLRVLGTLEEIQGCLDPEFVPEEGSEEAFKEGEVAEAAEEREVLKGRNEEEEEVDESV